MADDDITGWPFWAPSDLAAVDRALDLAGLVPGERFVDLGCGDGQVLVAAARRGAVVRGVECDEDLAEQARKALAANGFTGEVVVGDLFDPALELDADVVFTYLAPATLQRLRGRLRAMTGTRLVTVDFAVPGLMPVTEEGLTHLYRLPCRLQQPCRPGWATAGTLVVTVPDTPSLTCLEMHHAGGPVRLQVAPPLAAAGTFVTGADEADPGAPVAIDIRWEGAEAGTAASGTIAIDGVGEHHVTVLFFEESEGQWHLSDDAAVNLARRFAGQPGPATVAEVLAAAAG